MKKNAIAILTLVVLSMSIIACGGKEQGENGTTGPAEKITQSANEETEIQSFNEETESMQGADNTYTINGITVSADTFSVEPYEDSQGVYTKRIIMEFTIKNETDSAFGYVTTWQARLNDGYKLEAWADLMSLDLKQVASNSEKTDVAYFLIDDSIDPDEIIASYNFMDYGEEYWEDFGKIMTGEMGQEEYMSKYGDYKVLEFNVTKE